MACVQFLWSHIFCNTLTSRNIAKISFIRDIGKRDKWGWVKYMTAQGCKQNLLLEPNKRRESRPEHWMKIQCSGQNVRVSGSKLQTVTRWALGSKREITGPLTGGCVANNEASRWDSQGNISITKFHQLIKGNSQKCLEQG